VIGPRILRRPLTCLIIFANLFVQLFYLACERVQNLAPAAGAPRLPAAPGARHATKSTQRQARRSRLVTRKLTTSLRVAESWLIIGGSAVAGPGTKIPGPPRAMKIDKENQDRKQGAGPCLLTCRLRWGCVRVWRRSSAALGRSFVCMCAQPHGRVQIANVESKLIITRKSL
jgi:hypothetical protein